MFANYIGFRPQKMRCKLYLINYCVYHFMEASSKLGRLWELNPLISTYKAAVERSSGQKEHCRSRGNLGMTGKLSVIFCADKCSLESSAKNDFFNSAPLKMFFFARTSNWITAFKNGSSAKSMNMSAIILDVSATRSNLIIKRLCHQSHRALSSRLWHQKTRKADQSSK